MNGTMEIDELAAWAGIPGVRLENIEDGDRITIVEALRLASELGLSIAVEPGFRLLTVSTGRVAHQYHQTPA